MSDLAQRLAGLSPAQRQLLEKRLARQQPTSGSQAEPIAVVGMGCRFAGAASLEEFWKMIVEGRDGVKEIPPERWDVDRFYDPNGDQPGKISVRWAALVDRIREFDPQFFGITPREAAYMDPQQRLLLEVAWETMENAGWPADRLAGSDTGVFVGIGGTDYTKVLIEYTNYYQDINPHSGTGNALSIASNRISYTFDLHGPSLSVDTACSSSSLAVHLAAESLRRRGCSAAFAGGVNAIITPETTIAFSKARMLSPEGRCRPFDARANGYVRGEGCGLVLLKRLEDALRDGDQIWAVLRATAVNQDGRTSGISAPSGESQKACIRTALAQAGLTPADVSYVEAHGTGTPLGDPIEMQALGEIFADDGTDAPPCYVTSVKANVGHLETVSGVAGLIKVALMMQHNLVPPQTHFESLNPHISLHGTRLEIPLKPVPWSSDSRRRVAGISSFGFGGTNTHLIVEAPPSSPVGSPQNETERPLHLVKLAARTETALRTQAARLAAHLETHPDLDLADVAYSANTGRVDFNHRLALTGESAEQLQSRLAAFGRGERADGCKQGSVRSLGRPKVAFLFTGQGSQRVGMGHALYLAHPRFRQTMDRCDEILRGIWGESLLAILYSHCDADDASTPLHQTQYTQPALFALEYALADLWQSWGVRPDIVLGHSVGEYVAACIAGVMTLEDGLRLIAERSRLMQHVERHGKMAVIFAGEEQVAAAIAPHASGENASISIAAANGPENTVISGEAEVVDRYVDQFKADGIGVHELVVSHAFHSPHMDAMLAPFEKFAEQFEFCPPQIDLVSNVTGKLMTEAPTARYWRDHVRGAVRFADGMTTVADAQPAILIEMGPTAALIGMGKRCSLSLEAKWLPSLRQGQDDWQVLLGSLGEFYCHGGQVDWKAWDAPWPRRRVLLPNYPFERITCWQDTRPESFRPVDGVAVGVMGQAGRDSHPLLGARLSTVWSHALFETALSCNAPAYLIDHQVQGSPVTPGAAYIEQALAAANRTFGQGQHAVENLSIQQAMFLPEGTRRRVQVTIAPESGGESTFESYSRPLGGDAADNGSTQAWTMHATGRLVHASRSAADADEPPTIDLTAVRERAASTSTRDEFYTQVAERGLAYGPAFQVLDQLHRSTQDATAEIHLPESVVREAPAYQLHPALGDALLQSMAGAVPLEADGSYSPYTYMPVGIGRVRMFVDAIPYDQPLFSYAVRTSEDSRPSPEFVTGDVFLADASGRALVSFEQVRVQRVGRAAEADKSDSANWLYRVAWRESDAQHQATAHAGTEPRPGRWLIFADAGGVGAALADKLATLGQASLLVRPGDVDADQQGGSITVDPTNQDDYKRLLNEFFAGSDQPCLGVVHLWSLDVGDADSPSLAEAERLGAKSVVQLLRQMVRHRFASVPQLFLVTQNAQFVPTDSTAPLAVAAAPLWGLGRVAALEQPDLRPKLIDLDREVDVATLVQELTAPADSDAQVAFRQGSRYVARLEPAAESIEQAASGPAGSIDIPSASAYQLRITKPGSFDALRFVPVERQSPAPGQVEVEVRATGLNFSDVLKALGLYPGIKDDIVPLGIEASGVVTAVGEGVERFQVGDEVMGVLPYAFASHARTAEYALVKKPAHIDHEDACTIPITFLTAYYALVHLAHLQPGERLLIHAGAGGVGLAAIQIAQHIGAEVYATAGSDDKRQFLRSLGVEHVYNSRTLDFADEVLADTNREGVDVVLNSLPGAAITKSLSILRAYGRFLEIGKIDIYQDSKIGLLPFQDNLSYFAIDLDRMLRERPNYIRNLFAEVMQHFAEGAYQPLMLTRFEADQTIGAFRYMQQRKNIGKVVVALPVRSELETVRADDGHDAVESNGVVRPDATYLITGGLGALGLRLAEWLAEQGAGAVSLLSRRPPGDEVATRLEAIRARGTRVATYQADVTDPVSLGAAIERMRQQLPPLRGVVHAAGVLADGVIAEMTLEQFDRAVRPKVDGAWTLHRLLAEHELDFFVMFSSVAALIGSPGQGNYAAGNAMLDALAHYRRQRGLPATTINWGPWADAGMAAEQGRDEAIQSRGMALLPADESLALLEKLIRSQADQVAVMDVDWPALTTLLGSRRPSLLAELATEGTTVQQSQVDHRFRDELIAADGEMRQILMRDYIRAELARIMGVEPASLDPEQPLSSYGIDSLLALELKNNLEGRLAFTLPMAALMEGPSINSLSAETVRLVSGGPSQEPVTEGPTEWTPLVTLRGGSAAGPLVLLPSLGGDIRCYDELVKRLPEGRAVYAIRPRGLDDHAQPHQTMDEMVRDYAAALREVHAEGPYHLAGWSTAGIYAFALARVLAESGAEVGLVALFDTPLPSVFDRVEVDDDARFLCDIANFANMLRGKDTRLDYDRIASLEPSKRFGAVLAEARRCGAIPDGAEDDYVRRIVHVGEANVRAVKSYRPEALNGATQVHMFVPLTKGGLSEVAGQVVDEQGDLGWSGEVGQPLTVHEVPGNHFSMMYGAGAKRLVQLLEELLQ